MIAWNQAGGKDTFRGWKVVDITHISQRTGQTNGDSGLTGRRRRLWDDLGCHSNT